MSTYSPMFKVNFDFCHLDQPIFDQSNRSMDADFAAPQFDGPVHANVLRGPVELLPTLGGGAAEGLTESDGEYEDGSIHLPLTTDRNVPFFYRVADYAWNVEWEMFLNITRQPHIDYKHFRRQISPSAVYHAMVARGGYDEVVRNRSMNAVTRSLGLERSVTQKVKQIYEESLISFENFKLRGISVLGPLGMRSTKKQNWVSEGKGNSQTDRCFSGRPIPIAVVNETMAIALASPLHNSNGVLQREFQQAAIFARKRVEQLCGVVNPPVLQQPIVTSSDSALMHVVASPSASSEQAVVAYPYRQPRVACWLAPTKASGSPISCSSGVNVKRKTDGNDNAPPARFKQKPNANA